MVVVVGAGPLEVAEPDLRPGPRSWGLQQRLHGLTSRAAARPQRLRCAGRTDTRPGRTDTRRQGTTGKEKKGKDARYKPKHSEVTVYSPCPDPGFG